MIHNTVLIFSLVGIIAFFCQWLAWRVKLPAILFLLAAGLIIGPGVQLMNFEETFGDLLFPLVSLAVAIILFEGSLTLDLKEIRSQRGVVQRLITVGALATWGIVAVATHYLFEISWELSVLFGALTVVTGPTVIVPMLRTVRPNANISNILRWEGILIDPIGALLVVVVFEVIVTQGRSDSITSGLLALVEIIAAGTVTGIVGGWLVTFMMKRRRVPDYLKNLATLSMVLLVFGLADFLAHESGLLAVTLMGMWLANQRSIRIEEILHFKENLTIVLISGLFIILAARLTLDDLLALGWMTLALLAIIQFVARPISVWLSTFGTDLTWRERAMLAWIAPRGIVAAAVSALFALKLEAAGEEGASLLVPLTFAVIFGTVVLQSATSGFVARWLKVADPEPNGFLVIGANRAARAIASELKKQDIRVLLTDSNWQNIRAARMDGLATFFGNPLSEYADNRLDLTGIGRMLGMTPDHNYNTMAGMRFGGILGRDFTYSIQTSDSQLNDKHQAGEDHRGQYLFSSDLTFGKLSSLLSQGATIRTTRLSEEFTWEDFLSTNSKKAVPLFAINTRNRIKPLIIGRDIEPEAEWKIISLFYPEPDEPRVKEQAQDRELPDS